MKQDPKNVQAEIQISSYGTRIRCDVGIATELFKMLARCQFVTDEWTGDGTCSVLEETLPRMKLSCDVPLTRAEFNSIREAERLEKEAAKPLSTIERCQLDCGCREDGTPLTEDEIAALLARAHIE